MHSASGRGVARMPLVLTKLDRLTKKGVALNPGRSVHNLTDPVGRLLFNVLGTVAQFEAGFVRARVREAWRSGKRLASFAVASPSAPRRRRNT